MSYVQIFPQGKKLNNEAYMMPWKSDAACYNFIEPDVFIPDDAIDEMIKDPLDVETLVVTADLEDYSFISKMKNLTQLYLYNAKEFWNLSIIKELVNLRQICIVHSKVICLDGLNDLLINKKKLIDAASNDFGARTTYGIEGIYIHSDVSSLRLTSIYTWGVYIGELDLNLYTGTNPEDYPSYEVEPEPWDETAWTDYETTYEDQMRSADMIRALFINANGEYEVDDIKKGHKSLELIVGGDIEGLTFAGHTDFIMFLNETGKIMGLPVNPKATIFSLEFTEKIDLIKGDVVICGIDKEGDSCDLTDEQISDFMKILDGIN